MGGSGKLSPSQSHEPRSKVATAVAAGKKKRCVCERRRGEAHRGQEEGVRKGRREGGREGGKGVGVRAANTAVERID